jgi:hypothetical protein
MSKSVMRGAWCGLIAGMVLCCLAGCETSGTQTSRLKQNWESYPSEHFVFYYPPNSPRLARMAEFAESCEEISGHLCGVLQIKADRTVDFFVFNSDPQCDSLLGRTAGFFEDDHIVIRIGQHPGGYVALAMCHFINRQPPVFDFLATGLFKLYAQPSVNVHAETFTFERQDRLIPLADLTDTAAVKDPAVYATEAASFCAFMLANYGPERFKMMWSSTLDLPESIAKIYGMDLDRFETEWRKYYRRETGRT